MTYKKKSFDYVDKRIGALTKQCMEELQRQGFPESQIETQPYLHLRYDRTDCALMCSAADYKRTEGSSYYGNFETAFTERYQREFGFTIPGRPIIIDNIRVRGVGKTLVDSNQRKAASGMPAKKEAVIKCYFEEGYHDTSVYMLEGLNSEHVVTGPAIIIDQNSTILVEPYCEATITESGDVKITIGTGELKKIGTELDTIQLSIFSHRFMSTAEQMGRILQRTAISTNIKERLDFSCAMFGSDGGLVANAPHIPVHLGAMQETVQYQMKFLGDNLKKGDMILTNHPSAGGSHLPDLTVITPVFNEQSKSPVFYVASRGHHADIGGKTPGSMPPHSKSLNEEGAIFKTFKLVKDGQFQEEDVSAALKAPGRYPDCSGTRNLHDNLADLRAQVAANQKGINLIGELINAYSLEVVLAYMGYIQQNAEVAVRDMLREIGRETLTRSGSTKLSSVDYMDDGTPIALSIDIDVNEGTAVFDFTGTGPEVYGNCNAPRAITFSAIIYCLRCMIGHDVPLNQGCLTPVKVVIPKNSILDPSETAAVVGGNVLTSQRIVDVVLKAFGICAASQGCMNNFTFGDQNGAHYETIAGGAGAGPTWDGQSGVHTHMTNTRITDPEILERRFPVILSCFQLKPNTGGKGRYVGGDGVERRVLFRKDMTVSVLTERRVHRPYGMKGGEPGQAGKNLFVYKDGRMINLGGKTSIEAQAGDAIRICTPGGGGYGEVRNGSRQMTDSFELPSKRRRVDKVASHLCEERGSVHAYRLAQEQV